MGTVATWAALRKDVEREFSELALSGDVDEAALEFLDVWLSKPMFSAQYEPILAHITHRQFPLLLDSFYQLVPFGTGGRRGRVGFGPNRINQITVAMSVQGHCDYLRHTYPSSKNAKVVVAFDTRVFADIANTYAFLGPANLLLRLTSRSLAHIACEIYAGNGFEVYVPGLHSETEYLSTPELSFAIRHLGAITGMNVSASHNHPDDNGFKFFNEQGAQDIPPTDQIMTSYMGDVQEIKRLAFDDAVRDGIIRPLSPELHSAYISINLALRSKDSRPLSVVYTPLCGTGDRTVGDVLRAAGYNIKTFEPHATYDGTFAAIPFRLPNPEVPEAASPALAMARDFRADLVLCTDPDADRLGVFAKDGDNDWRYLNGNEIASILAYYLAVDREHGPRRSGILIKTLVTTRMLQKIAELSGCLIVSDLLVGFKYIAHVLFSLEQQGRYDSIQSSPSGLIIAGEESHGVLLTPEIRDKDAAGGALVLCELVSQLRSEGKYLPEYLDALTLECGNYQNVARSIVMRGIRGATLLVEMMRSLRERPPAEFDGLPILSRRDFLSPEYGPLRSDTERLSRNLLVFETAQAQIVIRPSGTEPKAKIYVDVEGSKLPGAPDRRRAARFARKLAARVLEECIARIGFRLSASAHRLPDYVDLDLKADFDRGFRRDLLAVADSLSRREESEQLQWFRERLRPYGGGADPLGPTATGLSDLLEELCHEAPAVEGAFRRLQQTVAEARTPVEWVT